MSVSIAKLIEQDNAFKDAQDAQLQKFVEVSKNIKLSSHYMQQEAVKQFNQEKSLVDSVIEAKGSMNKPLIESLETDSDYVKALENVSLLSSDVNQPKCSINYIDTRQSKVDEYIEEKLSHE